MTDSRKLIEAGWQAALSCHARHGMSGWSSHRKDYIEYAIAAAEKAESEKDALLRQALDALELPCDRWNAVQYRIVHDAIKAIRNHLGVKND